MGYRENFCKHCGSPTRLSPQSKEYDTDTGKLKGIHYINECTKFFCRWSDGTTWQRLYIKEPE